MDFLVSIVIEWYKYRGYTVRSSPRPRKKQEGGRGIGFDVLAFSRSDQHLIHIETSGNADSWERHQKRFQEERFILSDVEYESVIGASPTTVQKIAIAGWSRPKSHLDWGDGIEVKPIPQLFEDISALLQSVPHWKKIVPLSFPLLRAIQLAVYFENEKSARPRN